MTYVSFFIDVVGALDHIALDENRNAVFIWSIEMCFMFVAQINVIFMRPLYEAVILRDCIINKYILHVLSIKLRDKLYFSFSIPAPGFPHFYYMLGANLGLLLYGEVSMMCTEKFPWCAQYRHIEHLHEEVWCQKKKKWQNDSFVNLAIFSLLAFKQGLCLCLNSACTGQSTHTTAFDETIWYFVYTIKTL